MKKFNEKILFIAMFAGIIFLGHGFLGVMFQTEPGMYQNYRIVKGQKQYLGNSYYVNIGSVNSQRVYSTAEIFAGIAFLSYTTIMLGDTNSLIQIILRLTPLIAQFISFFIGGIASIVFYTVNFPILFFLSWFGNTEIGTFIGADNPFLVVNNQFIVPSCFIGAFLLCIQIVIWKLLISLAKSGIFLTANYTRKQWTNWRK